MVISDNVTYPVSQCKPQIPDRVHFTKNSGAFPCEHPGIHVFWRWYDLHFVHVRNQRGGDRLQPCHSQTVKRRPVGMKMITLPALKSMGHARNLRPPADHKNRLKIFAYFVVSSTRPRAVENGHIQGKLARFRTNIDDG